MQKLKYVSAIIAATVLLSGCASSPQHKKTWQGASFAEKDIPLVGEYNAADFQEPKETAFQNIYFEYNSYRINQSERKILEDIAKWLRAHRNKELLIEGHCDERGSNAYNLSLGEKRALSIRRYLSGLGANAKNIYTVSYGEERPLDSGQHEEAWRKNRRAHFLISK